MFSKEFNSETDGEVHRVRFRRGILYHCFEHDLFERLKLTCKNDEVSIRSYSCWKFEEVVKYVLLYYMTG
jgi:hypothetical protein